MESKGHWQVLKASISQRNGGLYLEGRNHFEGGKFFGWHVKENLDNPEYDWSECAFEPGAREHGARVIHSLPWSPRCNPFVSNADMEAWTG